MSPPPHDEADGGAVGGGGPLDGLRRLTETNPVTVITIVVAIVGLTIAAYGVGRDAGQQDLEIAVQDRDRAEAAATEAAGLQTAAQSELEAQRVENAELQERLAPSPSPSASEPGPVPLDGTEVRIQLDMGPPFPQRSWDLTRNDVATTAEATDFFIEQRDDRVGLVPFRDAGVTASRVEAAGPDDIASCAAAAYTSETLPLEDGAFLCVRLPGQLQALLQVTELVIVPRPPAGPPPGTATTLNLSVTAELLDQ